MPASLTVSATWTPKLQTIRYLDSGDYLITFAFLDANGIKVRFHEYFMHADGSGVYEGGNQIAAVSPPTLLSDVSTTATHFDAVMTTAIGQGKVPL